MVLIELDVLVHEKNDGIGKNATVLSSIHASTGIGALILVYLKVSRRCLIDALFQRRFNQKRPARLALGQ